MYVGRSQEELRNEPLTNWTMEELAYFKNTFAALEDYLDNDGLEMLRRIEGEIRNRGGSPAYGGGYDHPSGIIYD